MRRLTACVTGLVQGVSFRYYTRREATRLGLRGWVRNETDGSVRVVAEGSEEALRSLASYLRHGPPSARVKALELQWTDASNEFTEFDVRF